MVTTNRSQNLPPAISKASIKLLSCFQNVTVWNRSLPSTVTHFSCLVEARSLTLEWISKNQQINRKPNFNLIFGELSLGSLPPKPW